MTDEVALEPIASFDSAGEDWSRLAEAARNVFLTPEWLSAWWDTFGEGRELLLRRCLRRDGSTFAILPLYRDESTASVIRQVGHTQSDRLGLVCAPEDRDAAAAALRQLLATEFDRSDAFVGNSLPVDERWPEVLGGRTLSRISSPTLAYRGRTWDEILAERSNHFRKRVRQVERRLERRHVVAMEIADEDEAANELEAFIALHDARWEGASGAFRGSWGELHRRFVPVAARRGWLRLLRLTLDGDHAGGLYNLRFGGFELNYQAARASAYEKLEVGLAMNAWAIRESIDAGLEEYQFLRGLELYKSRLADRDDPVETIVVTNGLRGAGLALALAQRTRLPRQLEARLDRLVD